MKRKFTKYPSNVNSATGGRRIKSVRASESSIKLYCAYKRWGYAYSGGVSSDTFVGSTLVEALWKCAEAVGLYSYAQDLAESCAVSAIGQDAVYEVENDADLIKYIPESKFIQMFQEYSSEEEWEIYVLLNETTNTFYIGEEYSDDPYDTANMDEGDWDNDDDDDYDEW